MRRKAQLMMELAKLTARREEVEASCERIRAEAEAEREEARAFAAAMKEEAERVRAEAVEWRRAEEERLLREAKAIREDASQQGFKEGREEGREVAAQKAAGTLKSLEQVLAGALAEKESVVAACERQMLDLSIAIAKKVVRAEITVNPEVIERTLRQALARMSERDSITVYVNLVDLEKVTKRKSEILKRLDPGSRVTIVEDENIEPGGLVIQTALGNIDATVSGQELEIDKILYQTYEEDARTEV